VYRVITTWSQLACNVTSLLQLIARRPTTNVTQLGNVSSSMVDYLRESFELPCIL
jgi:hypothetical protein